MKAGRGDKHDRLLNMLSAVTFCLRVERQSVQFYSVSENFDDIFGVSSSDVCEDASVFLNTLSESEQSEFLAFLTDGPGLKNEQSIVLEHCINAEQRWFEYRLFSVEEDKGEKGLRQGIMLDVTRFKSKEETLKAFRFAMDYAGESVFWMTEDGGFNYVNDVACQKLGYTREEFIQDLKLWDIDPGFPKERHKEVWDSFSEDEVNTYQVETFHRRRDGTLFPVEIMAQHLTTHGKRVHVAFARDVTERRQVQQSLRLTQFAIDNASIACFWIRPDGRFSYVNAQACRFLDYGKDELLNMSIGDVDADFSSETWAKWWRMLVDAKVIGLESSFQRKNNISIPVAMTVNHIVFDEAEYGFAFVTDLTVSHHMEKERERLEKQLRQAQKMEAIGSLAGGIAHDFNNILVPIISYTELLLYDMPEGTDERDSLEQVLAASLRAKDLVRQILAFSRQADTEIQPIHLGALVKEVIQLVRSTLPATIDITSTIPEHIDQIMADSTQIHQILMNLVTNAYHAMEEVGGKLTISVSQAQVHDDDGRRLELSEGKYVCLTVSDTGVGMSEEVQSRIFDPYFTTKGKDKGTGLGLAVVHGIVKSMDGDIEVKSVLDEGTSITVYLPRIASLRDSIVPEFNLVTLSGDERILLVDNDSVIVNAVGQMLTQLGYQVTGFTDSLEALSAFKDNPYNFDLLLSDMTMPHLTGDNLALLVRRIRPEFPILLLTGFKKRQMVERVEKIGIDRVLTKPLTRDVLAREVRYALEKSVQQSDCNSSDS